MKLLKSVFWIYNGRMITIIIIILIIIIIIIIVIIITLRNT